MKSDYSCKDYLYTSYKWIQVDEVQDLNPLQLAIIEKMSSGEDSTIIYLGDERQAIYAFLGANHGSTIPNIFLKFIILLCHYYLYNLQRFFNTL